MPSGGLLSKFDAVAGKLMDEAELTPKGRLQKEQWREIGRALDETPLHLRANLQEAQKRVVAEYDRNHPRKICDWEEALTGGDEDRAQVKRAGQRRLYFARDRFRKNLQADKAPNARVDVQELAKALVEEREEREREQRARSAKRLAWLADDEKVEEVLRQLRSNPL